MAVEAGVAFCLLVAFFYRPSLPGDRDQHVQGDPAAGRGVAVEEGQVGGVGAVAADQDPVLRRGRRRPRPVVVAVPLQPGPQERISHAVAGTSLASAQTAAFRP
jgi:hypothetical protein